MANFFRHALKGLPVGSCILAFYGTWYSIHLVWWRKKKSDRTAIAFFFFIVWSLYFSSQVQGKPLFLTIFLLNSMGKKLQSFSTSLGKVCTINQRKEKSWMFILFIWSSDLMWLCKCIPVRTSQTWSLWNPVSYLIVMSLKGLHQPAVHFIVSPAFSDWSWYDREALMQKRKQWRILSLRLKLTWLIKIETRSEIILFLWQSCKLDS